MEEKMKTVWNKLHESKREDERNRALVELHRHIDLLEKDARNLRSEVLALQQELDSVVAIRSKYAALHDAASAVIQHEWCQKHGPQKHATCAVCGRELDTMQALVNLLTEVR